MKTPEQPEGREQGTSGVAEVLCISARGRRGSSPRAARNYESLTHSLPLVRPSRASGFAQWSSRSCQVFPTIGTVAIATSKPFAASQAAQVDSSRNPHFFFRHFYWIPMLRHSRAPGSDKVAVSPTKSDRKRGSGVGARGASFGTGDGFERLPNAIRRYSRLPACATRRCPSVRLGPTGVRSSETWSGQKSGSVRPSPTKSEYRMRTFNLIDLYSGGGKAPSSSSNENPGPKSKVETFRGRERGQTPGICLLPLGRGLLYKVARCVA